MAKAPRPPTYLNQIAAQQWKAKSKQLAEREDLTPADWNSLELYCVNYSIYRKAIEDIDLRGFSVTGSRGATTSNPALKAKSDAEKIIIKISQLLGFDPVSRRRNPPETVEDDGFDDI